MSLYQQIEANIEEPEELERIYRNSPEVFRTHMEQVLEVHPTSQLLRAWHARFTYEEPGIKREPATFLRKPSEILLIVFLCLFGGTLAKLPDLIGAIDADSFYPSNVAFFVMPGIAFFFLLRNKVPKAMYTGLGLIFLGAAVYLNLMPRALDSLLKVSSSDTMVQAMLHAPFFLWSIVGVAFAGTSYRKLEPRLDYLKFNGEMLVYCVLLMVGGMVLVGISVGLFEAIGVNIMSFYEKAVIVYGLVSIPIVATYITIKRTNTGQRIAPAIARIFSPLVLLTLVGFLIVNAIEGKSPYTDRDFLIIFNIMLIGVLAITVFTVSERSSAKVVNFSDYIIFALIIVALLVDLIALSAIVFRLSSFGLTPNRLAVLGANLLVFGNLGGIVYYYFEFLRGKVGKPDIERWLTRYLPLYTAWTAFIVFLMPLLFWFK